MKQKLKENFKSVTNSRTYNCLLCKFYYLDEKHCIYYREYRQFRTWKHYRGKQYKAKTTKQ